MSRFGNRPDCAYFLLLGLCGAAFLLTIGGILTYIAFNPDSLTETPHSPLAHIPFHNHHQQHQQHQQHHNKNNHHPSSLLDVNINHSDNNLVNDKPTHLLLQHNANGSDTVKTNIALAIVGPLCLLMGVVVTLTVGAFALKYDCDHEPEPNIAFLRLKSEMSLSFDPEKNNYELLIPTTSSNDDASSNPAASNSPTFTMGDTGPLERFTSA